jgi:hypothetical protein
MSRTTHQLPSRQPPYKEPKWRLESRAEQVHTRKLDANVTENMIRATGNPFVVKLEAREGGLHEWLWHLTEAYREDDGDSGFLAIPVHQSFTQVEQ